MPPATDGVELTSATVRVGPAGWSYSDWAGSVYPSRRSRGFHSAAYLARYFDTIEINTSFYAPIRVEHAAQWLERVAANPRFLFTAKLWQHFTHDLAPSASPSAGDEHAVRAGFDVLRGAGKLGAVLLQFPFAFHNSPETLRYLAALWKRFADYPLVVEVRHASWKTDAFFAFLREHNAGFCNLDQPVIGRSLEPTAIATSEVATCGCMDAVTTLGSATIRKRRPTNATTISIRVREVAAHSRAFMWSSTIIIWAKAR